MADVVEESAKPTIKLTIKTPKEKQEITIEDDCSVKQLKVKVSEKFNNTPTEQLCLIFAGKILKDDDTLKQHSIKDGLTVHLVIKSVNRSAANAPVSESPSPASPAQPAAPPRPDVSATPFGLGGMGGLAGLGGMGLGSGNFAEMQQRAQQQLMSDPEMMRQMLDSPLVQQFMSNPDMMREMILSNPQMRDLTERNPDIGHMLNNPELMRQTMEIARNPAMMQELMRSQDRAMSNLESLPGGFNALQRMYRDVQEPMMNAAQETIGGNPFSSLVSNTNTDTTTTTTSSSSSTQQGRENTEPLPNPWSPRQPGATSPTDTTTTGSGNTNFAGSQNFGAFNSPAMQSLIGQMSQNPQLMQNMLQAPYMRSMMQQMAENPDLASQIMGSSPLFQGNPQLQQQMRAQMPHFMSQLQNPEIQRLVTNPQAMQAMMQIQQGLQNLQREAPGLMPTLGMGGPGVVPGSTGAGTTTTPSTAGTGPTTTTQPNPAGTGTGNNEEFGNLMAQMLQMMSSRHDSGTEQPPEQRFAAQLEQLQTMGFVNTEANIQALTACFGDVNAAIDRLLQQQRLPQD